MAVASAASELLAQKALDIDLVMLIEGEEESGSDGLDEVVRRNRVSNKNLAFSRYLLIWGWQEAIGPIDAILVR